MEHKEKRGYCPIVPYLLKIDNLYVECSRKSGTIRTSEPQSTSIKQVYESTTLETPKRVATPGRQTRSKIPYSAENGRPFPYCVSCRTICLIRLLLDSSHQSSTPTQIPHLQLHLQLPYLLQPLFDLIAFSLNAIQHQASQQRSS